MSNHEEKTQQFSTWGDKLLQHTDVLYSIQYRKMFRPLTIQLAPVELCSSDCPFCSVAKRPLKSYLPYKDIEKCLIDFKQLGAKSIEITGGGEPLLYLDKNSPYKENINNIIQCAGTLGYKIGIITNSHSLKAIDKSWFDYIDWIRISLIKLDEGKAPEDYDFCGFPYSKLGFSYIIYDSTGDKPDEASRTGKPYNGTSIESINKIAKLVELHPEVKFVRIAGNCLIKNNNAIVRDKWKEVINQIDKFDKFFIKDIGEDDGPYNNGCYVGAIRPYIAPSPHGDGKYYVYTCTSHVLNKRTYDLDYALCEIQDIIPTWYKMDKQYVEKGYPYEVKGNGGKNWCNTCKYCYYKFNNKLLHTVAQPMPDKDFA